MLNNIGLPGLLFLLIYLIFLPICFWKIYKKAGFAGYWGLAALIPLGALILIAVLAFADWPSRVREA